MYVLDLFSGIGGFSLGLERAGFRTAAFCEIGPYCRRILAQHWPGVPIHDDIRKLDGTQYAGTVDVVCGGYPCQPFSVAGKQEGEKDPRHLWPEMHRIIREVRPRWVVCENVRGHINLGFDTVASQLEDDGFTVWPFIVPACAVGAPHRRDRLWIVGYSEHNGSSPTTQPGSLDSASNDQPQGQDTACEPSGASLPGGSGHVANASELHRTGRSTRLGWRLRSAGDAPQEDHGDRSTGNGQRPSESPVCGMDDEFSQKLDACQVTYSHATDGVHSKDARYATPTEARPHQAMPDLFSNTLPTEVQQQTGGHGRISETEILQPDVHDKRVLQRSRNVGGLSETSRTISQAMLRGMRNFREAPSPSPRPNTIQQHTLEPDDVVRFLSHALALDSWTAQEDTLDVVFALYGAFEEIGHVPEALSAIPQVWRCLSDKEKRWVGLRLMSGAPWCEEWPDVPRVATGIPDRVNRLKALGNSVVPQIPEAIGRTIIAYEHQLTMAA